MMNTIAFVDTTVLTDALLKPGTDQGKAAVKALASFSVTQLPAYAIKEFRAGPFRSVLWLYNRLAVERDLSKVWKAINALYRQRYMQLTAFQAMTSIYDSLRGQTLGDLARKYGNSAKHEEAMAEEYRLALKSLMYKAWRRRRKITSSVVDDLVCFAESELIEKYGTVSCGIRRCPVGTDCCLRPKLVARKSDLKALRSVVEGLTGREHEVRERVLRQLVRKPKQALDEQGCRSLGDAVFAFFAPVGSTILTTNVKDHQPLAAALGKSVRSP